MLDIDTACGDFVAICVPSGADTSTFTLAVFIVMLWGLYDTFALCLTIGHYIHEKARQTSAGLLFLVTRHSCPGDYAARAKTSSLAAFAVTSLLGLRPSPGVLPSLLSHPVEARSGPSETYFVLQYGPFHKESHGLQICFWWTRWESNPRPEPFWGRFIQQYNYLFYRTC